ncbi:hypothetical protein RJ55_05533 [Drechmeria coniospora]|nr:hypothetical protein RJ55_05533 [Drechmeria coniospora]
MELHQLPGRPGTVLYIPSHVQLVVVVTPSRHAENVSTVSDIRLPTASTSRAPCRAFGACSDGMVQGVEQLVRPPAVMSATLPGTHEVMEMPEVAQRMRPPAAWSSRSPKPSVSQESAWDGYGGRPVCGFDDPEVPTDWLCPPRRQMQPHTNRYRSPRQAFPPVEAR